MRKATRLSKVLLTFSAFVAVFCVATSNGQKIGPDDYRQIQRLVISADETFQMEAGKEHQFLLYSTVFGRAGRYREVAAPVTWSIKGDRAISISDKGLLKVGSKAKHGAKASVIAVVKIDDPWKPGDGYVQTVEQKVIVFDPRENPLVGIWSQTALTSCSSETIEASGNDGLEWLEFRADGSYSAAITLFEVYRDHWGTYEYDLEKGTIKLQVTGGNNVSTDLKTEGAFAIRDGSLVLSGLQLYPDLGLYPAPCKTTYKRIK